MSMPRGRCDVRAKDQSAATPEQRAPIGERFRGVAHYNRLELGPLNCASRQQCTPRLGAPGRERA